MSQSLEIRYNENRVYVDIVEAWMEIVKGGTQPKIVHRMSLPCQPTLSVSRHSISPIHDYSGPYHSSKTMPKKELDSPLSPSKWKGTDSCEGTRTET